MKEFTNLIKVLPVNSSGKSYDFMADFFTFTPSPSDDDAGMYYNCDKTFVVDMPEDDTIKYFAIPRSCIVEIKSSDQITHSIGTEDIPAKVKISVHLNMASLVVTCKMLHNPLF